jgi:hypothetical protein
MGWFGKSDAEKEADRRIASQEVANRAAEKEAEVQRIVDKKNGVERPQENKPCDCGVCVARRQYNSSSNYD